MPYHWVHNIRAWFPSRKYRDEKQQLAELIDETWNEKQRQFEELGYYTTTQGWAKIEDWVDDTLDHYRYHGASWWERNWFGVVLLAMIGGSMLVIGLVNGWS